MELKKKQELRFRGLCGLLILMACCFRTAAVLQGEGGAPLIPGYESFLLGKEQGTEAATETTYGGQTLLSPLLFLDPSLVEIDNRCNAVFDQDKLFREPLSFALSSGPCVLIVHTHGSEAYRDSPDYRSSEPDRNVIRVGAEIADRLNAAGIPTIQDTTAHDMTSGYNDAYGQAAQAIEDYLEQYPSIQMVIDVHRDAASDGAGGQKPLLSTVNGKEAAQLMLVMGTDTAELPHAQWERNLSLAIKLQAYFNSIAPGIMRQTSLRAARYNEHLTPHSILLEVGSAGNSLEEALLSASFFGDHLARLLMAFQVGDAPTQ